MKHLHKTLIGSALTLALAGCNDFLDLSSYDEVSSGTAFSTTTLAESVVVGAYSTKKLSMQMKMLSSLAKCSVSSFLFLK